MTHWRILLITAVLAFPAGLARGADNERGPLLAVDFSGSSTDPGWIFKLDTTAGYQINGYLEIDCGLPVYFVRIPSSATVDGLDSKNGIGNAYVDVIFVLSRSDFFYSSTIRGTAPTGDAEKGFSTGRATFDWSNYFERTFGPVTPFGSAGIANTISDTHFFNRPFTSLGLVGHFEGGIAVDPFPWVSFAGSGYAVTPSGEQKIYSRIARSSSQPASGPDRGNGRNRVFEETTVIVGTEEIAKDHGFSGWIDLRPASNVTLELGYSRSISYDYNSLFFSVRLDFARMLRRARL